MTDDIRDFVHERFRRADEKLDKVIELLTGFAHRLNSLLQQVAGLRLDFADLREDLLRIEHRPDRSDERCDLIARGLELIDTPT